MTTPRPNSRAEQRRQTEARILDAATQVFFSAGYDRTTIRAVASAAGVDAGLVMHYFGSKQALLQRLALDARIDALPDLALEAALERQGAPARTLSAFVMPEICELFTRAAAHKYLAEGRIVLLGGGTGNPFFTTDTTAVLRAAEIDAEAVLKATNVDGVYSADPKKDPSAKRFDRLTHAQAIEGGYKVMDATAFALARETSLPIIVFSIAEPGSMGAMLRGQGRGTVVAG